MLLSTAPCMALSGTLVRSQQVRCKCGTSLISLCLEVKRVLSSAVKSYHLVLMGSQQWQLLIFWGVLFDQQLKGDYPTTGSGIFTDLPMTSGDSFKCWHDLPGCWE